jgi:hypothetical protein
MNIIYIPNQNNIDVIAIAYSTLTKREEPYIVRKDNFMYIADSPFASATETDRYIYFADMLHDLLGERHLEIHRALLRIEDVTVFEKPSRLRDIADALYSRDIPFLVGVIPYYVDPDQGVRLRLSDKPELVDALRYMVSRGGTIVMHGVTHQYQGTTATDFEFWDGSLNTKIKVDSRDYVEKKIKTGLEEFWKNNLYPLLWETPHYTASQADYPVFAEFFSTAMEQRCVLDDADYSQYFPYIIEHDLFGQRIFPENLGYIPLNEDREVEEEAVAKLLRGAKMQLAVRDGWASAFIHSFIDIEYIEEYVDGIKDLGYTFVDVKTMNNWVKTKDKIVLTGDQLYQMRMDGQYLRRIWIQPDGDIDHQETTADRQYNIVKENVNLAPGMIYIAEVTEFKDVKLSWTEKLWKDASLFFGSIFRGEEIYDEARVALLWDPNAVGGAYNNQASFAGVFRSLNIDVDTLHGDSITSLQPYNLLVVPYHAVERLTDLDYEKILQFVQAGGNVIADGKNGLAEEMGIKYATSGIKVERMRDRLYPEDALVPKYTEIMTRFDLNNDDEVFCVDDRTDIPVVIGRNYGKGKLLFFGIRFDPISTAGYSRFPYIMEYVRTYFHLQPILRRENLEVYFDDGYRHNISIEDLVKRWTTAGVRVVHVVGWHQYKNWTYDYGRLIRLCHANSILVYAWLDPPQISEKFWKDNPKWQELNYRGEAVRPSWRYPVALTDTACLAKVKEDFKEFLLKYDWDGVNLAELYFEAGVDGPRDSLNMTPMHPSFRNLFKKKEGFDPASLFNPGSAYYWRNNPSAWREYEDYRVEVLTDLHEELLSVMEEVRRLRPYFDVVITAMDNLGSPELRRNHGVDILKIMDLKKRFHFTLQVEDPQTEWSKDPRRYYQIAKQYRAHMKPGDQLMLDLNILQFREEKKPTMFPTLIQTGIECYQLINSAATAADRVGIYSESSVRPQDLRMLSFASSSRAEHHHVDGKLIINAPFPLVLELPKQYTALITSTGERITSDRGMYFLPTGEHILTPEIHSDQTFYTTPPTIGRLLTLSGELMNLTNSSRSISFSYQSSSRCYAAFSHRPYTVLIDGKETDIPILEGHRRYSIVLPEGEHDAIVILATTVSYGVDITSYWSSLLIVGFGLISGGVLITFYTVVRISRPRTERKK